MPLGGSRGPSTAASPDQYDPRAVGMHGDSRQLEDHRNITQPGGSLRNISDPEPGLQPRAEVTVHRGLRAERRQSPEQTSWQRRTCTDSSSHRPREAAWGKPSDNGRARSSLCLAILQAGSATAWPGKRESLANLAARQHPGAASPCAEAGTEDAACKTPSKW